MPNSVDLMLDGKELSPDTKIWRYVKLSTLFYLLKEQRSFLPKLTTLQKEDPFEGKMTLFKGSNHFQYVMSALQKDAALGEDSQLLKKSKDGGTLTDEEDASTLRHHLDEVWMRELARRRIVWCWHESENECMGQWRIYAREAGVAICSDVGSVLKALMAGGSKRDVAYGRISYLEPNMPAYGSQQDNKLAWYPTFIKNTVFAHEREVRFVLEDGPKSHPGYVLKTAPEDLIKEVVLSPFILPEEAMALKAVIEEMLNLGQPKASLKIPVKLSGALSLDYPDGKTKAGSYDALPHFRADHWITADSLYQRGSKLPSVLNLFPETE